MLNKIMTVTLAAVMCLSLLIACKDTSAPSEFVEQEQQIQPVDVIVPEEQTELEAEVTVSETEETEPETQEVEPETESTESVTEPEIKQEIDDEEFEDEEEFEQVPPPAIGGNMTAVA